MGRRQSRIRAECGFARFRCARFRFAPSVSVSILAAAALWTLGSDRRLNVSNGSWTLRDETDTSRSEPWFVSGFGVHYRDLYHHRNEKDARRAIDFLHTHPSLNPETGPVLDLCCGSGRHCLQWIERGASAGVPVSRTRGRSRSKQTTGGEAQTDELSNIIGLDLSADLLRDAMRASRAGGLRLPLVRGDMRRLPFAAGAFHLVLNLFTSFGYFDDDSENAAVFHEIARVLVQPGGHFVFDHINPGWLRDHLVPETLRTTASGTEVRESRRLDHEHRRVIKRVEFESHGRPHSLVESVCFYEPDEVEQMAAGAGLKLESARGGFEDSALTPTSPRAVYVFRTE